VLREFDFEFTPQPHESRLFVYFEVGFIECVGVLLKIIGDDSQPQFFEEASYGARARKDIAGHSFVAVAHFAKDLFDEGEQCVLGADVIHP
jgi:hypothetical protein